MYIAHLSTAVTLNQTVLNTMVFQQRSGHRVAALCPDDEWTGAIRERGIEIIPVPFVRHSLRHSFTSAAAKAYAACRREQFDVVHTHTLLPGIAGRVAARLADLRATSAHLIGCVLVDEKMRPRKGYHYYRKREKASK
ncbi:MAG TPA: glycosyltransferase [Anaerolineaceae bacterium]|mgnify:CR=1 FL=1|nr:glycosyltransferase [Anaerolineaceae bacterium]